MKEDGFFGFGMPILRGVPAFFLRRQHENTAGVLEKNPEAVNQCIDVDHRSADSLARSCLYRARNNTRDGCRTGPTRKLGLPLKDPGKFQTGDSRDSSPTEHCPEITQTTTRFHMKIKHAGLCVNPDSVCIDKLNYDRMHISYP